MTCIMYMILKPKEIFLSYDSVRFSVSVKVIVLVVLVE